MTGANSCILPRHRWRFRRSTMVRKSSRSVPTAAGCLLPVPRAAPARYQQSLPPRITGDRRPGSGDDRTPMGVHEGLSCVSCHDGHGESARASCATCHPEMSHCGIDVEKMDTTFAKRDEQAQHSLGEVHRLPRAWHTTSKDKDHNGCSESRGELIQSESLRISLSLS